MIESQRVRDRPCPRCHEGHMVLIEDRQIGREPDTLRFRCDACEFRISKRLPVMVHQVFDEMGGPRGDLLLLGRCATCRWAETLVGLRGRSHIECTMITEPVDLESEPTDCLAFLSVDSPADGSAQLVVFPDFGCVMWEARELKIGSDQGALLDQIMRTGEAKP